MKTVYKLVYSRIRLPREVSYLEQQVKIEPVYLLFGHSVTSQSARGHKARNECVWSLKLNY